MPHYITRRIRPVLFMILLVGCQASEYNLESEDKKQHKGVRELKDMISETVLPAFTPSQTRYADGYTEEAFDALPKGASQAEAESALGRPLVQRKCGDESQCWHYSEAAGEPENYFVRVLVFDQDGHLVEKHRSLYVD